MNYRDDLDLHAARNRIRELEAALAKERAGGLSWVNVAKQWELRCDRAESERDEAVELLRGWVAMFEDPREPIQARTEVFLARVGKK